VNKLNHPQELTMKTISRLPLCLLVLGGLCAPVAAQRPNTQPVDQTAPTDSVAAELSLLRQALQTLNSRLQAISREFLAPDSKQRENQKLKEIATNFDLLTQTEQRAEVLRKQLLELIEKETSYRVRLTQMEEEMRPENIERSLSTYGTTRTAELRDTRRRSLETERKGIESLLNLTTQSRLRLEEDVRQADQVVSKLRQRLFPQIEKQIEKLNPIN
jgi:hypothetical protein